MDTPHVFDRFGQPIGEPVSGWRPAPLPPRTRMTGRAVAVEPLDPAAHAEGLFDAFRADADDRVWTYLPYGPFETVDALRAWVAEASVQRDPVFRAIVDAPTGRAIGVASYLRLQPEMGVIEVGHLNFAPALQRTPAATEAMFLMMRRVFDELGYRRYEWKCDALNARSRRSAERLGFRFEGVFRQAAIYKGRNRDTAWFSILDREWPALKAAYETWLAPSNFDDEGDQRRALRDLIAERRGPGD